MRGHRVGTDRPRRGPAGVLLPPAPPARVGAAPLPGPSRPRTLSTAQAGRALGLSDDAVRAAIGRGLLTGVRVGRLWRVDAGDVDALLSACQGAPAPGARGH